MWVLLLLLLPLGALANCGPPDPCQNGGTCDWKYWPDDRYQCYCPPGWTGDNCTDVAATTTAMSPSDIGSNSIPTPEADCGCIHGTCSEVDLEGGQGCRCDDGWEGQLCDQDVNECYGKHEAGRFIIRHRCQKGRCVNKEGGYDCDCQKGFEGTHCENKLDCNHVNCLNGGTCRPTRTFKPPFFRCQCQPGFSGTKCERRKPCHERPCQNGGRCQNRRSDFRCFCRHGWTGKTCTKRDPCFGRPCHNGGSCQKNGEDFQCSCLAGWTGKTCTEKEDVCEGVACSDNGTCEPEAVGLQIVARCRCDIGFAGSSCEDNVCQGVTCNSNGQCEPVPVGFHSVPQCECNHGYDGDSCQNNVVDRLKGQLANQTTLVAEKQRKIDQLERDIQTFISAYDEC